MTVPLAFLPARRGEAPQAALHQVRATAHLPTAGGTQGGRGPSGPQVVLVRTVVPEGTFQIVPLRPLELRREYLEIATSAEPSVVGSRGCAVVFP